MTGRRFASVTAMGVAVLLTVAEVGNSGARAGQARPEIGDLTGQLLVAAPEMPDPRFMRTVIFLIRHDASGTMGLVLNRPMGEIPLARLLERHGGEGGEAKGQIRVHYGGPVERTRGFVLHTADYSGTETQRISDWAAVSWDPAIFRAIAAGTGPRRSFVALGYSGWGPGQLETEIRGGGWVAVPADEALVFDQDYDGKWSRAMARRRISL